MNNRQKVVDTIAKWVGCVQGDATHKHIVDTYNNFVISKYNKGRKVKLGYSSAWCAATVTAAFYESGMIDLFPCGECSCGEQIKLATKYGIWQENDAYRPSIGDTIIYAWDDSKDWEHQDNTTGHDHTGIVQRVYGDYFDVIEGNKGNGHVCGIRKMKINGKNIRGFITPKYEEIVPEYYIVKKGDTLGKIAISHNTTLNNILLLNPQITNPNLIRVGQKVRIK